MSATKPGERPILSGSLAIERQGDIAIVRLNRAEKRNALDDATVQGLGTFFARPPEGVRAVVLCGAGEHFGAAPVIAVLQGAVVGGGLELACAAHIRVAETSAFYALPEGQRGIFVGGGASVRVPRIIGAHRMADMMFTGRVYSAEEGQAVGLSTYLEQPGKGLAKALELARKIAGNAPTTNFALMHALPRIAELGQDAGLFMESLMAAIAQSEPEAKARMRDFVEKGTGKVRKS